MVTGEGELYQVKNKQKRKNLRELPVSQKTSWREEIRLRVFHRAEDSHPFFFSAWRIAENQKGVDCLQPIVKLVIAGAAMFATLGLIAGLSGMYSLNIRAKTVGHGQHGTARWATKREIKKTYTHVRFEPQLWRKGEHLPTEQGIVVGVNVNEKVNQALMKK